MKKERVVLFIDAKNLYFGARDAFFSPAQGHVYGQFDPIKLGQLICSRPPPDTIRELNEVRIYLGRPDASRDPKTYSAHMKQCAAWEQGGAVIITRTLRYPRNWPQENAQEKGTDVALAIDYITLAIDGKFDAGIIASTDTDLKPALEYVYTKFVRKRRAEVTTWRGEKRSSRLSIAGAKIWCHWLDKDDYYSVADFTNYAA